MASSYDDPVIFYPPMMPTRCSVDVHDDAFSFSKHVVEVIMSNHPSIHPSINASQRKVAPMSRSGALKKSLEFEGFAASVRPTSC